ncbi:carbohydrate ABC transporter substrate-binding protein, CUT1 family (TC 3.A.1.1.-) [Streptomyces sp. WMMB 714]|jgi:multiple sugar transport system substrate-binding protein|uniref:extracellular solute-binding protein n=1 Tax=Streptomyces sp. WMMB 714 TaxID=1286822 RepID=UPI000695A9DF|nr:extracellular solute-binding protein [Streptomyces sp. WMMB 714]SCK25504.1 carbohydrate ABC transporter substrate-binding protein, CUT1 family (TC 3.A.1.1.-) [Streptomyces sp. WMMB 714]
MRMQGRRRFLGAAGGLAAAGALSGCSSTVGQAFTGSAGPPSLLNFWHPFTGGDGAQLVAMQDRYRKRNPGTDLKSTTMVWGAPYYTKLTLATLGRRPPQVAITHMSRLPTLAASGLLRDISRSELAEHGMQASRFNKAAFRRAHLDGKLYALPLDTHPFVLFFRKKIAEKAGLLDGDGELKDLDGPEKFLDAMRAAKEVTGVWGGSVASIKDPGTNWRIFWTLYRQLGADLVADGGRKVVMDVGAAEEALAYIRRMTAEKLVPTGIDYTSSLTLLTSGKAGFLMDGEWQLPAVRDAVEDDFGMRTFPRIFRDGPYACAADSHAFILPTAPSEKAQRTEQSLAFTRAMLDSSLDWAKGGHIPAWEPTARSDAYGDLRPQADYASAADGAAYDPAAWYAGADSILYRRCAGAIASVQGGRARPGAAADAIHGAVRELAKMEAPV